MKKTAIYIHIPFCDHKCIYCDFYSLISYENVEIYLEALKKEIKYYSQVFSSNRIIDTIFFGGGTPSFMTPKYIGEIIQTIDKYFKISDKIEITLETNPGTVNKDKLKELYTTGVNRISIGIQSFNDKELKFLTRIHDKSTAINTALDSAEAGFNNISIDLIFSLPNQLKKVWQKNLETAVSLPIQHISAYSLILERGTILNKMVLDGKVKMARELHDSNLYKQTMSFLNINGFNQYEVSNFAKEGYECLHNLYYWEYKDYLGFGTAAHSFIDGKRWWNFSSLKKYISEVEKLGNAVRGKEVLTQNQKMNEKIMLGLRSTGIDVTELKNYSKEWYIDKKNIIDKYCEMGFLQNSKNILKCTSNGYMLCDEIIQNLL